MTIYLQSVFNRFQAPKSRCISQQNKLSHNMRKLVLLGNGSTNRDTKQCIWFILMSERKINHLHCLMSPARKASHLQLIHGNEEMMSRAPLVTVYVQPPDLVQTPVQGKDISKIPRMFTVNPFQSCTHASESTNLQLFLKSPINVYSLQLPQKDFTSLQILKKI